MPFFRKRPITVEAIQYSGKGLANFTPEFRGVVKGLYDEPFIVTLEGRMKIKIGDWIIKGVNGEFYPCKPDIFEKTYEEVESQ